MRERLHIFPHAKTAEINVVGGGSTFIDWSNSSIKFGSKENVKEIPETLALAFSIPNLWVNYNLYFVKILQTNTTFQVLLEPRKVSQAFNVPAEKTITLEVKKHNETKTIKKERQIIAKLYWLFHLKNRLTKLIITMREILVQVNKNKTLLSLLVYLAQSFPSTVGRLPIQTIIVIFCKTLSYQTQLNSSYAVIPC